MPHCKYWENERYNGEQTHMEGPTTCLGTYLQSFKNDGRVYSILQLQWKHLHTALHMFGPSITCKSCLADKQ